jgi:hypothetical protein
VKVKNHYPKFDSKEVSKEKLFAEIKPGEKYDDVLMRKYNFKSDKTCGTIFNS